jgi:hypothetical protein
VKKNTAFNGSSDSILKPEMGNEVSSQQMGQREDISGEGPGQNQPQNQNQNCAMQHLKLADWESSGIQLHEPIPINKNPVLRLSLDTRIHLKQINF